MQKRFRGSGNAGRRQTNVCQSFLSRNSAVILAGFLGLLQLVLIGSVLWFLIASSQDSYDGHSSPAVERQLRTGGVFSTLARFRDLRSKAKEAVRLLQQQRIDEIPLASFDNTEPEPDWQLSSQDDEFIDSLTPLNETLSEEERTEKEKRMQQQTRGQRVKLEQVLKFNMLTVGEEWDRKVGCARFREKHSGLLKLYRGSEWVASSSFKSPLLSDQCHLLKKPHITVRVINATWLPDVLDTTYSCPPCHLSCIFGRQTALTPDPDALLYEGHLPNISRAARVQPLRVYLNMEVEGGKHFGSQEGVDVWVGYNSNASVQATYAAHMLHWDRQRYLSTSKRKDVLLYHAVSNFVQWRDRTVKGIMTDVSTHSFGSCRNNMAQGETEISMYPYCEHTYGKHEKWHHHAHCVQSHYLFTLAIENQRAPGYVTEKFFYALESGTVPVYIGAPDIEEFAPPDSYIDASNLSPEELSERLQHLADNPMEYMNYHAWRRCGVYGHLLRSLKMSIDTMPCRLCEHLSKIRGNDDVA